MPKVHAYLPPLTEKDCIKQPRKKVYVNITDHIKKYPYRVILNHHNIKVPDAVEDGIIAPFFDIHESGEKAYFSKTIAEIIELRLLNEPVLFVNRLDILDIRSCIVKYLSVIEHYRGTSSDADEVIDNANKLLDELNNEVLKMVRKKEIYYDLKRNHKDMFRRLMTEPQFFQDRLVSRIRMEDVREGI